MIKLLLLFLVILAVPLTLSNCKTYSFTGAEIGTAKTISIQYFPNKAPLNAPQLSQVFTEKIKTKFIRETSLKLVDDNGDMQISGTITDYRVNPVAIQSNTSAAQNRLTITVNVKFVNITKPENSFEQSFSNFADFDATQSLSAVENDLIQQICDKIVQEIFNKAVINW